MLPAAPRCCRRRRGAAALLLCGGGWPHHSDEWQGRTYVGSGPDSCDEAVVARGQRFGAVVRPQHVRHPVFVDVHDRDFPRPAIV